MRAKHLTAPLVALIAVACVTNQPPPLLTISERACAAAPDLSGAFPVVLKTDSAAQVIMDHDTACLQPAGEARRLYAIFRLPTSDEPFSLSVTSVARGLGVFAPYLLLLDANGVQRRTIPHDRFLFRGNTLQAGFRPQPGETFLLVASDPDVVGQETKGIVGNTNMSAVPVGTGGMIYIYSGTETTRSITRAHSGIITVSANPLPKPVSAEGKTPTP
jgi:hypothetical protein